GELVLAPDHWLHLLLNEQPNPHQTPVEYIEQQMLNLLIDGNYYDRIIRFGDRVTALWPMAAPQMEIDYPHGATRPIFKFMSDDGGIKDYDWDSVLQVKLFGNSLKGLSPLGFARSTVENAWHLQNNSTRLAEAGNKPGGTLMIDRVLKPDQRTAVRENF